MKFLSHMKLIGNSNTVGILVLCNYLDCVFQQLYLLRYCRYSTSLILNCLITYNKDLTILVPLNYADIGTEESKHDTTLFSIEETHPSFLFFHIVLHNSSTNHVCPRGRASRVGHLLCASFYVTPQHSSSS